MQLIYVFINSKQPMTDIIKLNTSGFGGNCDMQVHPSAFRYMYYSVQQQADKQKNTQKTPTMTPMASADYQLFTD